MFLLKLMQNYHLIQNKLLEEQKGLFLYINKLVLVRIEYLLKLLQLGKELKQERYLLRVKSNAI